MKFVLDNRLRLAKFAVVGGTCFLVQFLLLTGLVRAGLYRPVANGLAFAVSAQLNFLLSSMLTWADRPAGSRGRLGARWLAYNATALLALACDSAIFIGTYPILGTTLGAATAVLASTCVVFVICNFVVFRPDRAAAR